MPSSDGIGDTTARSIIKVDLNGDFREDAIVRVDSCGGSCSHSVYIVLNAVEGAKNIGDLPPPASAIDPRSVGEILIDEGVITADFLEGLIGEPIHKGKYKIVDDKIVTLQ